jgi:hypothetical protein
VPQPSAEVVAFDWKTVGTYCGIAVSIFWSFLNWKRTSKIEIDSFRTKQWDKIEANINTALDLFVSETSKLAKLPMLGLDDQEISKKLNELSQAISIQQDELARRLGEADQNSYVEGNEWELLAEGLRMATGSNWDIIVQLIADSQENSAKIANLDRISSQAGMIRELVNKATRKETARHDPRKR